MERARYPSDLTDGQWERLAPLIPRAKTGGHPRTVEMREVMDAIFYVTRGGVSWRMMPHDLPKWQTAYGYFRRFRRDGTWERMNDILRTEVRRAVGREDSPSAAIVDSQSAKTTEKGGPADTTRASMSAAASATSWSTRSACSWR